MTATSQQWTARQDRDYLMLIPPLAEDFSVYGEPEATERAREWALAGRYLLAEGIPPCAHGLYLLASCPAAATCLNNFRQLAHASVWVPWHLGEDTQRPFVLCHPRAGDIAAETTSYGTAHGLDIASYPESGDDWYGAGTIPIRMTIPQEYPVWPIEAKAAILLRTQPVAWPEDGE